MAEIRQGIIGKVDCGNYDVGKNMSMHVCNKAGIPPFKCKRDPSISRPLRIFEGTISVSTYGVESLCYN